MDIRGGFRRVGDDQRRLKEWWAPIEIRPSKENSRSLKLPALNFAPKSDKGIKITAHVADRGDPVRKQERKYEFAAYCRFAGAGEMDVHINESRNKKFSSNIESLCAARDGNGFRRADRRDFFVSNENRHVRLGSGASGVDESDMSNGERWRRR